MSPGSLFPCSHFIVCMYVCVYTYTLEMQVIERKIFHPCLTPWMTNSQNWVDLKTGVRSFFQVAITGLKDLGHPLLFSQVTGREMDGKCKTWVISGPPVEFQHLESEDLVTDSWCHVLYLYSLCRFYNIQLQQYNYIKLTHYYKN